MTPAKTNLVVLWGRDACSRFPQLVQYWNSLLDRAAWDYFVYLLAGEDDVPAPSGLSHGLLNLINRNTLTIRIDEELAPLEITELLRQKMATLAPDVALQCVCADFETLHGKPQSPLKLMQGISENLGLNFDVIFYLLLEHNNQASALAQREFLRELAGTYTLQAYPYFISKRDSNNASVNDSRLWRALSLEILANAAGKRRLLPEKVYALGYSALNAENTELHDLRRQRVNETITQMSMHTFSQEQVWKILTQQPPSAVGTSGQISEAAVHDWLQMLVLKMRPTPDKNERKNLLILSRADNLMPNQIPGKIEQFYMLNAFREVEQEKASSLVDGMIATLQRQLHARTFPVEACKDFIKQLERIKDRRTPAFVPRLPEKTLLQSKSVYLRRCWEDIEAQYHKFIVKKTVINLAGALWTEIRRFQSFLENVRKEETYSFLIDILPVSITALINKYPRYWNEAGRLMEYRLGQFFSENSLPPKVFFDTSGNVIKESWIELRTGEEVRLKQGLRSNFGDSFSSAVVAEFSSEEELTDFFNSYLPESRQMFFNIHERPSEPLPLFFADSSFSRHPWVQAKVDRSIIVGNDNVERLDMFQLSQNLNWYLEDCDSSYFSAQVSEEPTGHGGRLRWDQKQEEALQTATNEETPAPLENPDYGLTLRRVGTEYYLSWEWKPGDENARVRISSEERLPRDIFCSNAEFNAMQGVNVTHGIDYGCIDVRIYSGGILYARKRLVGKRHQVHYETSADTNGSIKLRLKGLPEHIAQLVVRIERRNHPLSILYPITPDPHTEEEQIYRGLSLAPGEKLMVIPRPDAPFPQVEVV